MIPEFLHSTLPEKQVDTIEVFVNDFTGATNNADLTHLLHLSRCMLYGIHSISPPLNSITTEEVIQYLKRI